MSMSRYRDNCPLDCKVYVGELGNNGTRHELEEAFGYYGPLRNVWVARNPPGFAFIMYEDQRDARDAVRALNGKMICGRRVRVELSSGKTRREMAQMRSSGGRGHYSSGGRSPRGRSPRDREKNYSRDDREYYKSRSRRSHRSRSRSRSGTPIPRGGRGDGHDSTRNANAKNNHSRISRTPPSRSRSRSPSKSPRSDTRYR